MHDLKKPATSDEHGRSWYARLSAAPSTMLLQLIYVSSKYYDVNGKVVAMSSQTTVNLMGRISTPGVRGTFPPFPVYRDLTVAQWIPYVLEDEPDPKSEPEPVRSSMEQTVLAGAKRQEIRLFTKAIEKLQKLQSTRPRPTGDYVQCLTRSAGSNHCISAELAQKVQPHSYFAGDGFTTGTFYSNFVGIQFGNFLEVDSEYAYLWRQLRASRNEYTTLPSEGACGAPIIHVEDI